VCVCDVAHDCNEVMWMTCLHRGRLAIRRGDAAG